MSENLFLRPKEFYVRDLNPVRDYVEQNSFYLHRMTGRDLNQCKHFIVGGLKNKRFEGVTNPVVDFYERNDFGDREVFSLSLTAYLKDVLDKKQVLAPTFTTYKPYRQEPSIVSEFMDENVHRRSAVKKEGQLAESEGNKALAMSKDNEQANMKTYNNSLSGTLGSEGSVLANETGHNTLTSITRTLTSIGNALNERIISGNRQYRNPDVTLDNVIFLAQSCNREELQRCMDLYQLVYPSTQDVMEMIKRSTSFYWTDMRHMQDIEDFVASLTPLERAAVMYTHDLYHVRQLNPEFIRCFISNFSDVTKEFDIPDPIAYLKKAEPEIVNYAHQVIYTKLAGKSKDYTKIEPEIVRHIACISQNIANCVAYYKPLINAFFLGRVLPSGTAYIASMVRRTVVLSDTDSTMFAVDEWVQWYFGKLTFQEQAFAVAGSIMFFATQCIAHCLAMFSANMGVDERHLFRLSMKPEFVFPVFAQTSVAKHYFTFKLIKEGMVYASPDPEIKGVHLKNSAAPQELVARAQKKMVDLLQQVLAGDLIDIDKELLHVADVEREISKSLLAGELIYFKRSRVKAKTAYTKGALESPFQHHTFWQMAFAKTYSDISPPPYSVIKIPTTLDTPTATKAWIESIENPDVKEGLIQWVKEHNKKKLPTVYLNADYVKAFGLPQEIIPIINTKKVLLELTMTHRMILDSLGFGIKPNWLLTEMGY